ncbi:MAG: trigger factor [Gaiellales bacterium]
MDTQLKQLSDTKVSLDIQVPEDAVFHAFEHAASDLAKSMSIPGFRKGKKVPLPVVASRVGRDTLAAEAVRTHIDSWFWEAASANRLRPVAEPEVDWETMPTQGERFRFTATVEVMPKPAIADWRQLEVGMPDPGPPDEAVDAEIEVLRAAVAELETVDDRPVQAGDTVVVDLKGDQETGNYVLEVGAGRIRPEIEQVLIGVEAGETKIVETEADGRTQEVQVSLKEIQQKVLPPVDDELARTASEFDTLDELRADIGERLVAQLNEELEVKFREDAIDALADASTFERIESLVMARTRTLLSGLAQSLERRGVTLEAYVSATGQTPEQLQERMQAEADRSVRRELVLEAVADELELEVSDDEIEQFIRGEAEEVGDDPDSAVEVIRERGGFPGIRDDLRFKQALDQIVAEVQRIPVGLAKAREKLWTPEKEKGTSPVNIWTPGSQENQ